MEPTSLSQALGEQLTELTRNSQDSAKLAFTRGLVESLPDDPDIALHVVINIVQRFGFAAQLWTRSDLESGVYERPLTDEEWGAIHNSKAWDESHWVDDYATPGGFTHLYEDWGWPEVSA